ncbi:MAG: DNA mismatch repair protein MutT [Clostridia bacterium]|nr:DNA mismatch repair protein MutT [Clostridia bacterium]
MKTLNSKLLYKTPYLELRVSTRKFYFAQRKGINSTATLCFHKTKNGYEFLMRYQPLPVLKLNYKLDKVLYPCPITGSIEKKETPQLNAIKEVLEESGYKITKKNIISCVLATASTQMNEVVFHFLVDLTKCKKITDKLGDGSYFEDISENK